MWLGCFTDRRHSIIGRGFGLQWSTVRNLALAWVLTLPAAIVLSGSLYWVFAHVF